MNHFEMDWYMKEEQKREERLIKNQTHLLNQELARVILKLSSNVNESDYEDVIDEYNRELVQSSVWRLGYLNNFENPLVIGIQLAFIALIIEREDEKGNGTHEEWGYVTFNLERMMTRFRHHDMHAFQQSLHLFPHLQKQRY